MLYLADCFRLSGTVLSEYSLRDENSLRRHSPGFAVLASYSVELYIKCLLAIEGRQLPTSHDIKFLFGQLPRETREGLRKKHDEHPDRPGDLDEMLEKGGDTFNKVRYLFERHKTEFGLNWLGEVIRQRIISLHPDWEADDATFPPQ